MRLHEAALSVVPNLQGAPIQEANKTPDQPIDAAAFITPENQPIDAAGFVTPPNQIAMTPPDVREQARKDANLTPASDPRDGYWNEADGVASALSFNWVVNSTSQHRANVANVAQQMFFGSPEL